MAARGYEHGTRWVAASKGDEPKLTLCEHEWGLAVAEARGYRHRHEWAVAARGSVRGHGHGQGPEREYGPALVLCECRQGLAMAAEREHLENPYLVLSLNYSL